MKNIIIKIIYSMSWLKRFDRSEDKEDLTDLKIRQGKWKKI